LTVTRKATTPMRTTTATATRIRTGRDDAAER
jgi:hypothetical protein